MATRLYLSREHKPLSFTAPTPDAGWEKATGHLVARLGRGPLDILGVATTTIAAQGTSGNDTLLGQFISAPLDSNQTISGNVKGQARFLESAAGLDARTQISIRVIDSGGSVRGTLLAMSTGGLASEFVTSLTNRKVPIGGSIALSSVNGQTGDRIVVEVGARQHATLGGNLSASFGYAATDLAEDESTTTANAPWIEFDQTITFDESDNSMLASHVIGALFYEGEPNMRASHVIAAVFMAPAAFPTAATGTGQAYDATVSTTSSATNVDAGLASGTGSASNASASLASNAEAGTGSGAAGGPSSAVSASPSAATGTGAASVSAPSVAVNTETATGTGAAYDATVSLATAVQAAVATGTGSAPNASISIAPNTEAAAGTGAALDATVSLTADVSANAEVATGTGSAHNASISVAATAAVATGTGQALGVSPRISASAGAAAGSGTALDPTVVAISTAIHVHSFGIDAQILSIGMHDRTDFHYGVQPDTAITYGTEVLDVVLARLFGSVESVTDPNTFRLNAYIADYVPTGGTFGIDSYVFAGHPITLNAIIKNILHLHFGVSSVVAAVKEWNVVRTPTGGGTATYSAIANLPGAHNAANGIRYGDFVGDAWRKNATGAIGDWWRVDWNVPQTINRVMIFDGARQSDGSPFTAGRFGNTGNVEFSDGSSVAYSGLNDTFLTLDFAPRTVTWMRVVSATAGGSSCGLAEAEAYNTGQFT